MEPKLENCSVCGKSFSFYDLGDDTITPICNRCSLKAMSLPSQTPRKEKPVEAQPEKIEQRVCIRCQKLFYPPRKNSTRCQPCIEAIQNGFLEDIKNQGIQPPTSEELEPDDPDPPNLPEDGDLQQEEENTSPEATKSFNDSWNMVNKVLDIFCANSLVLERSGLQIKITKK